MKPISRDLLLFAEAGILIGPLTGFVAYSSVFVFVGCIALLASLGQPVAAHDIPFICGLLAFPFGVFALRELWSLAINTAKRRLHSFRRRFWFSIASAIISSIVFSYLFWPLGVWFGIVPAICLLGHMAFLQWRLYAAQPAVQPDVFAAASQRQKRGLT